MWGIYDYETYVAIGHLWWCIYGCGGIYGCGDIYDQGGIYGLVGIYGLGVICECGASMAVGYLWP